MKRKLAMLLAAAGIFVFSGSSGWAQSTSYFSGFYGFGDSLTDNGRIPREANGYSPTGFIDMLRGTHLYEGGRWSNAPGYFEQLPSLIGVRYVPASDYAIGGAQAVHQDPNVLFSPTLSWGVPDQIDQFTARTGRFGPRDLALLWIGYNDLSLIPVAASAQARAAGVSSILANNLTALNRLVGLGAHELLVFNQQTFRGSNRDLAASFNAQFPGLLAPLAASGINVHYFDVDSLVNRFRANPTAFGYIAAAATGNCSADPACAWRGVCQQPVGTPRRLPQSEPFRRSVRIGFQCLCDGWQGATEPAGGSVWTLVDFCDGHLRPRQSDQPIRRCRLRQ
jgi:outer membrane lipase/esterase